MILESIPPDLPATNVDLYEVVIVAGEYTMGDFVENYNGTGDGTTYTFDLQANGSGDFWCVLNGVSDPPASAFPVRDDVAYPFLPWKVVAATIRSDPPTPDPITGLCNLLFSIVDGSGSPVLKASVYAQLDNNSTYDGGLVASTVYSAQTDADGLATLVTIRNEEFTAGGIYTLRATDRQGLLLWTKRVRIPNTASANAEDLTAV